MIWKRWPLFVTALVPSRRPIDAAALWMITDEQGRRTTLFALDTKDAIYHASRLMRGEIRFDRLRSEVGTPPL